METLSSPAPVANTSLTKLVRISSRNVLFAVGGTVTLFALLGSLAVHKDPLWRYSLFQNIATVVFTLVLLRTLLLRPSEPYAAVPQTAVPDSKGPIGLILALAVGVLAYAATLPLYFICDDFGHLNLIRHPFMSSIWPQITKGQFDGLAYIFYRPLGFASLFLDFQIWHYWAPGYHLTNLVLDLICIAAVYYFCKELELRQDIWIAASLIFAVLPVNVQAITWIGCRFDQLATALGMWSLTFMARFKRTGQFSSYGAAMLLFVLAVISKESAYVIPILWLSLEFITTNTPTLRAPFTKRSEPLLGCIAVPMILLLHRYYTLGGLGGYRLRTDGSPLASSFGISSLLGVLVRAPGETLFGYNWLLPGGQAFTLAAGTVSVVFLLLALFAKPTSLYRRLTWLCLIWVFIAPLPAHFYFREADPGLFYSRALHFGSMGIAILIAVLIGQVFKNPKTCLISTGLVSLLLLVGVQHNIRAWRIAAVESSRFQKALGEKQPSAPPRAVYYIKHVPDAINGVPFFTVGLDDAVQFHYSWRNDIRVRTESSAHIEPYAITLDMTPQQSEMYFIQYPASSHPR